MKHSFIKSAASVMVLASGALSGNVFAQTAGTNSAAYNKDPWVNALIKKGIFTQDEANQIASEIAAGKTNDVDGAPESKWKIPAAIKSIGLYGDARFRYEYRDANNPASVNPAVTPRERFRYSFRFGIKGDLFDDFSYGVRLETSTNPRSPWVTFGDDSAPTPSAKTSDGINLGQLYINWHPTDWYEMTVGRMPMQLYTTPMVWDSDISPEGAFEKVKWSVGNFDVFADFGQFDYQNPTSSSVTPSGDVFILAWQAGANWKIDKGMSAKIAPVVYTYTGVGSPNGINAGLTLPFTGQGTGGANPNFGGGAAFNQNGINDLMVLEIPAEFNFEIAHSPLGKLHGRFFGDFAVNLDGDNRAKRAAAAAGLPHAYTQEVKAYQAGFGVGSDGPVYGPTQGLVYGTTAKKQTWEARVYWQHVEQYALDVNLLDSDFLEGRGNLEGIYSAFAYSFTDAIIGTVRYGYGEIINHNLGTGGSNSDLPGLNPINNYRLVQFDLTLRF